jgi:hypothetical protein
VPKTRRRNPSREQFWRDTLASWKASGHSVRALCAARGRSEPWRSGTTNFKVPLKQP